MDEPLIVVNCKTYATASGQAAETLATMMQDVETDARMVLAVSALDLGAVSRAAPELELWVQHLDPVSRGSNTGRVEPLTAIERGAKGTLTNHAERKVPLGDIDQLLAMIPANFEVCACAADTKEAKALAHLSPSMIAVEPPELIGGDISVTTADPSIVRNSVNAVSQIDDNVRVLCGAGIKNGQDVLAALDLGASGVLLASGVTKSPDIQSVLNELVSYI